MTVYELKHQIEKSGKSPYFFSKDTMRFFGDTMKNYGVSKTELDGVEVYELRRKHPVKHGLKKSAYFNAETFERIFHNE